MNSQDKDQVHLIVREYFDQWSKDQLPKILDAHINACPHGQRVNRLRWIAVGVLLAVGVITSPILARMIIPLI